MLNINRKLLISLLHAGVKKGVIAERLGIGRTTLWRYLKDNPIKESEKADLLKKIGDIATIEGNQNREAGQGKNALSDEDIQKFLSKEG